MNKKYMYMIIGVAAVVAIAVAGLVGCQDRGTDMPAEVVQTAQPTAEPTAAPEVTVKPAETPKVTETPAPSAEPQPTAEPTAATPAPTQTAQPAKTTQSASTPAPAQPAAPVEPAPAPVEPAPAPVEPEPAPAPAVPEQPEGISGAGSAAGHGNVLILGDGSDYNFSADDSVKGNQVMPPEPAAPSEPSTPSGPPQDWTKPIEGDGRDYDDPGEDNIIYDD